MKLILRQLFAILLVTNSSMAIAQYDIVHRTEKLLTKEKYINAISLIKKSLQKDSSNVAVYQALALYFTSTSNPSYHLDSAHQHNLSAISYYDKAGEKVLQKLNKNDITSKYLLRFKNHIDSLAFLEAIDSPTISNYNHYISLYNTSDLLDSAITLRDLMAFEVALQKNTYHSYKSFIEKYPNAVQIEEAKARFEKLYFDESVKDGQLSSYLRFLEEHPQSDYRSLAEKQILELSTLDNSASSYLSFVKKFPSSQHAKIALDYTYHLNKIIPGVKTNLSEYYDSLRSANKAEQHVLFPIYNNGYGFIDTKGEIIIPVSYSIRGIVSSACHNIYDDFIWIENKEISQLITKSGIVFWKGDLDRVSDLGAGLIQIIQNDKSGLIHKSGKIIFPIIYEDIKLLNEQFVAYQENGHWGLVSTLGKKLVRPLYQSITQVNDVFLFQQKEKWALSTQKAISKSINTSLNLSFIYDDFEHFDENHIIVYNDEKVNLISNKLETRFHESTTDINALDKYYITKDINGHHVLDQVSFEKFVSSEKNIKANHTGVYYQEDHQWNLWNGVSSTVLKVDSLFLVGDYFLRLYNKDSMFFLPRAKMSYMKDVKFSNLQLNEEQYILVDEEDHLSLLDSKGSIQQLNNYDKVTLAGDSLLIVEQDQLKGLINITNEAIVDIKYDAIQRNDSTTFTLLKDSKFGIYNISDNTHIEAIYSNKLTAYNESFYIANQENLYGLIDHENNIIAPFNFDEIKYWNNTSVLAKKGYEWIIYDFQNSKPLIDQISQYSTLNTAGTTQIVRIFKENGFGVLHTNKGELIPPSFYNINQIKQWNITVYIAEKYIEEADFYVVIYYDDEGNVIFKHAMESKDYQSVNCKNP